MHKNTHYLSQHKSVSLYVLCAPTKLQKRQSICYARCTDNYNRNVYGDISWLVSLI